jgi:hypothetical protein
MLGETVKGNGITKSETDTDRRFYECPECGSDQIEVDLITLGVEIYCQDCHHFDLF